MMKKYWRVPYRIKKEAEDPMAIVSYTNFAAFFDRGSHPEGNMYLKPVGWHHRLSIDLWIVVLEFRWFTGIKHEHHVTKNGYEKMRASNGD